VNAGLNQDDGFVLRVCSFGSEGAGFGGDDKRQFPALAAESEAFVLDRRRCMREPPRKRYGIVVAGCLAIIGELGVRTPLRGYLGCHNTLGRFCRGGTPWPPVVVFMRETGGHRVPPLQLLSKSLITRAALPAPARVESAAG